MEITYEGEYKITKTDSGQVIREINQDGKSSPAIKTPAEKAKEIIAGIAVSELEKTDLGRAVKALLVERGLI